MFKHNLLITFRNLKKFKGSFLINLAGLSTGLACAILIFLWVNDELHFDKFHEKDSRLYQVMELSKEIAWWAMHSWLNGFAYKIDIGANVFLQAFVSVVLITVITVSFHAIKAAVANPAKSLRTE